MREREPRATLVDAVLIAVAAVAFTFAIVRVAPTAANGNPTADVITQVLLVAAIAVGAFVLARRFPPWTSGALIALLTGLFLCAGAAVILNATPFAPLGTAADQGYRTAYLTKFGHGWGLVDYAYKGLPSFYPPLYFWILGRLSALLGIASWKMLKVGLLAVAFIVPAAGWLLWRPVTGPRRAAAIVVVTSLAVQDWYVPHLWLAIALFVPWWLWFVLGVGRDARLRWPGLAGGIVVGVVIALTYWYVVVIGLLELVVLLALRPTFRRAGRTPEPRFARDAAWTIGGVAVVTAVYWLPLVVSVLTTPGAQAMQNRYVTADEAAFPAPFLAFTLKGMVLLFGLAVLALTASRSRVALHLLGLVAAAYLLYAIGYLGFLADTPLDTLRTTGTIEFCLAAGAALGAVDLALLLARERLHERLDPASVRTVVIVGALVVIVGLGQTAVRNMPYLSSQRTARYPTAVVDGFRRATNGRYPGKVVLTDVTDLSTFLPTYVFNTIDAHYSHPAALFNDRANLLTRLAHERDPTVFALVMLHNRYDDIDYIALEDNGRGLGYSWLGDAFPRGVEQHRITFPHALFATDAFHELDDPTLTVYRVDRRHDPLRTLRACPSDPSSPQCALLGTALTKYGSHLDDDVKNLARRWRTAPAR